MRSLGTPEFEDWWGFYPRKVAKLAAFKAYQSARREATAAELLAGLLAYCQHLPRDRQFIAHASSWLRAGRWLDQYDEAPKRPREDCHHDPPCHSSWWHDVVAAKERGEL